MHWNVSITILAVSLGLAMTSCRPAEEPAPPETTVPEVQPPPVATPEIGPPPGGTETADSTEARRVYEAPDATIADSAAHYRSRLMELGYQITQESVTEQEARLVGSRQGREVTVTVAPRPGGGVLVTVESPEGRI